MWYNKFDFYDKQIGLAEIVEGNYFSKNLTENEILLYPDIQNLYPEFIINKKLNIPSELTLQKDHKELLEYSNGGGIINEDREFGYFSIQEIRYYYFAYGFPKWTPYFLPIAFNGGGKFYAYDFRDLLCVKIVAVVAGDLSYESSVIIGKNLNEVLSKTTNIEDELDIIYQKPTITEKDKNMMEVFAKLEILKKNKTDGKIDLKTFLLTKQKLELEIKELTEENKKSSR